MILWKAGSYRALRSGKRMMLRDYFPHSYLRGNECYKYGVPRPGMKALGQCGQVMCV